MNPSPRHRSARHPIVLATALALLAGGLLWNRAFRLFVVSGSSMLPTFHGGDILVVRRNPTDRSNPTRGDVVVARVDGDYIVKRVVGLPGERVALRAGCLWVDGRPMTEPYTCTPGRLEIGEGRLFTDRYALVGDNRSEETGWVHAVVPATELEGRVVATLRWPLALLR